MLIFQISQKLLVNTIRHRQPMLYSYIGYINVCSCAQTYATWYYPYSTNRKKNCIQLLFEFSYSTCEKKCDLHRLEQNIFVYTAWSDILFDYILHRKCIQITGFIKVLVVVIDNIYAERSIVDVPMHMWRVCVCVEVVGTYIKRVTDGPRERER